MWSTWVRRENSSSASATSGASRTWKVSRPVPSASDCAIGRAQCFRPTSCLTCRLLPERSVSSSMPMRLVFMTPTQARRAPGSAATMRRTVSRCRSSSGSVALLTSTAARMIGARLSCSPTEARAVGSAPSAPSQRRQVCSRPGVVSRPARSVSAIWSGWLRSCIRCAALGWRSSAFTSRQRRMISCSHGGQSGRSRRGGTGAW